MNCSKENRELEKILKKFSEKKVTQYNIYKMH